MPGLEPILAFLLLLGSALLIWIALQIHAGRGANQTSLERLDARLDEQSKHSAQLTTQLSESDQKSRQSSYEFQQGLLEKVTALRENFERRQGESQRLLQESLQGGVERVQRQLAENQTRNTDSLVKRMESLTKTTDDRLKEISGQVERRLTEGFEKTNKTFSDIQQRLALIDDAQKKITELSSNVVSLQRVLADRTARGAFGEVQLHALISNVLPEKAYSLQHTLSNGRRVDCLLLLPEPTGRVPIDSKFPLENYRRKIDPDASAEARKAAERDFARDVQTHIDDVASKYIIPGETAGGALLFIPAEAVFAEIHANHYGLVEHAQRARVWLASPTTLMAILTTAAAVIKDSETREQVHIIQKHLHMLAVDFERFQDRMDALSRHIGQANTDVGQVAISARKITGRFLKIEKLELETPGDNPLLPEEEDDTSLLPEEES